MDRYFFNFVISLGRFFGNIFYLVIVIGEIFNGYSFVVKYKFNINFLFVGGRCDVDMFRGEVMRIVFFFECSGWYDEDKLLKYKFFYKSIDGIEMVF